MNEKKMKKYEILISMTGVEWSDMINALYAKMHEIKEGRYDGSFEASTADEKKAWLKRLQSTTNKLKKALKKKEVPL
jgi:hypothetical protein